MPCRPHIPLVLLGAIGLLLPARPAASQPLPARLDAVLDAPPADRHLWGVALTDSNGTLLFGRNHDRLFIPASNTKLVVTATAAALLPPDWTVATSAYGTGAIVGGVLQGDLVLYGRGDPAFSERCYAVDTTLAGACDPDPAAHFRELARQLGGRGIASVAGDIVGDGSWFEPETVHPAWESYDLAWWYAAPVSGLAFNDNSIEVKYRPGASVGAPVVLEVRPDYGTVVIENRAVTAVRGERSTFDIFRDPAGTGWYATGVVPIDDRGGTEYIAVRDPARFAAEAFRAALAEAGIGVRGRTLSTADSTDTAEARRSAPLAEVRSRPLRDWIFPILNTSQNLFAEQLLKQLGRQFGSGGSWEAGLEVERRFLIDSVGVDSTQIALSDGSGLASTNLVTPLAFTRLLTYMRRHPHWETFAGGLPRAGQRGSLRSRFGGTPLEGRVLAKTGSISRVNTLSGYIEEPDGTWRVFSIQANHHTLGGRRMIATIDSVVVEMGR